MGKPGPVFGSSDNWKGMGLFFDSFDNDGEVSFLCFNGLSIFMCVLKLRTVILLINVQGVFKVLQFLGEESIQYVNAFKAFFYIIDPVKTPPLRKFTSKSNFLTTFSNLLDFPFPKLFDLSHYFYLQNA